MRQSRFASILAMILLALMAAGFLALCKWQWDRMEEKEAEAVVLAAEQAQGVVTLTGKFDHSREKVLESQMREGVAGYRIITPLQITPMREVLVDRGWIPREFEEGFLAKYHVADEVSVYGVRTRYPKRHHNLRETDYGKGPIINVLDPALVPDKKGITQEEAYFIRSTQPIARGVDAFLPPLPDGQQHKQYALTWFSMAALAIIGMLFVFWRTFYEAPDRKRKRPTR